MKNIYYEVVIGENAPGSPVPTLEEAVNMLCYTADYVVVVESGVRRQTTPEEEAIIQSYREHYYRERLRSA